MLFSCLRLAAIIARTPDDPEPEDEEQEQVEDEEYEEDRRLVLTRHS